MQKILPLLRVIGVWMPWFANGYITFHLSTHLFKPAVTWLRIRTFSQSNQAGRAELTRAEESIFNKYSWWLEFGHDSCSSHESPEKQKLQNRNHQGRNLFHSTEPELITAPAWWAPRLQASLCQDGDDWWVWVWGGCVRWRKQMDDLRGRGETELTEMRIMKGRQKNYFSIQRAPWRVSWLPLFYSSCWFVWMLLRMEEEEDVYQCISVTGHTCFFSNRMYIVLADFRDLLAAASSCAITKVISREINEREDEMFLIFLIKAVK